MDKVKKYLNELAEVYCYCLMKNHFHLILKIKSDSEINEYCFKNLKTDGISNYGLHSPINIVSKQIGKVISSYSQSFNKVTNRHGALMESPFKRIKIENDAYLKNLILYIHQNPIKVGYDINKYKYSSYRAIISDKETNIKRNEVLNIFDGLENFIYCHKHIENNFSQILEF